MSRVGLMGVAFSATGTETGIRLLFHGGGQSRTASNWHRR
jgi:hypothetical protein